MHKEGINKAETVKDIAKYKREEDEAYYRKKFAEEKKANSYHNTTGKYKKKDKLSSTWTK